MVSFRKNASGQTGIVVILDPLGRVLIQHRTGTAPWMPGWWDLPGGSVEPGESVSDAARREAKEEAGVDLSHVVPLGSFGDGIFAFLSQQAQRPSTHLKPNPDGILEHDAHVWVGPEDIDSYKILPVALKAIRVAWQKSMLQRVARRWVGGFMAQDVRLTIHSREEAENAIRGPHPHTHLISIGDPERTEPVEGFKNVPNRLALFFHDVSRPWQNYLHPKEDHVKQILQFAKRIRKQNPVDLMIHCEAGISRSTAAGFIVLTSLWGPGSEARALAEVLRVRSIAYPNELMVELADHLLKRGGRMVHQMALLRTSRHQR